MATQDEVLEQLGPDVTAETLRNWARRHAVHRVKMDGQWWIHLEAAMEVEWLTRESGLGNPTTRRGVA